MVDVLIYKQYRSTVQLACQKPLWVLEFAQKHHKPFDKKTGRCGMSEPLQHHKLFFVSQEKAEAFAVMQNLSYRCC